MKEASLGESIVVRWQIDATPVTTTGTPTQGAEHVALSAQLIGPFSSLAAIKQATTADGAGVNGPVALSSQPITDVCRNQTYASFLDTGYQLNPGYYDLMQIAVVTSATRSATTRDRNLLLVEPPPE
jgi:hypothetical protein